MSTTISSYRSYTFPSTQQRTAWQALKERSHLINEILAMSRAPLKQEFKEDPLQLLHKTLKNRLDISDIARALYSDSTSQTKHLSIIKQSQLIDALTLPIFQPSRKHITTRNPALETANIIEERCQEAIKYLYPKTLKNHPWLQDENPKLPDDTEWFVKTILETPLNKLHISYGEPFEPEAPQHKVGAMTIAEKTCVYKQYTHPSEEELKISQNTLDEERIANILFATDSPLFPKVLAITSDAIFFEYLKKRDLLEAFQNDSKQNIPPKVFINYAINIIDACIQMELKGFIHADLKLENCFLTDEFTLKLGDLGFTHPLTAERRCGTRNYLAPEILQGRSFNTIASQVFSFGIILFEYLYEIRPEELLRPHGSPINPSALIQEIRKNPKAYADFFKQLVQYLSTPMPAKKTFSGSSIRRQDHPIINALRLVIIHCLDPDPLKRPSFEQIKEILTSVAPQTDLTGS